MKQRFIDDLRTTANNVLLCCDRLDDLTKMREQFHGGEMAKLTFSVGETTLSDFAFLANGKGLFADELFTMFENGLKAKLNDCVSFAETVLEAEGAE